MRSSSMMDDRQRFTGRYFFTFDNVIKTILETGLFRPVVCFWVCKYIHKLNWPACLLRSLSRSNSIVLELAIIYVHQPSLLPVAPAAGPAGCYEADAGSSRGKVASVLHLWGAGQRQLQAMLGRSRTKFCRPLGQPLQTDWAVSESSRHSPKKSGILWYAFLPPIRRPAGRVVCGISQRPQIKGLKFFRFSDYPLLLAVDFV